MFTKPMTLPPLGLGLGIEEHKPGLSDYSGLSEIIAEAINIGYRFFDTATSYGEGQSEIALGIACSKTKREELIIASKIAPDALSHKRLLESFEMSLQRLNTSYIDILQIHWPNPDLPLEDTVDALKELLDSNRVGQVGVCNFPLSLIKKFQQRLLPYSLYSIQSEYNLFNRTVEESLLPYCRQHAICFIGYSPLCHGALARSAPVKLLLQELSEKYNQPIAAIILSYLMSKGVTCIPNTSNLVHLKENMMAMNFSLTINDIATINHMTMPKIEMILPGEVELAQLQIKTIADAQQNIIGFCPSPIGLAETIKQGANIKPIYLKKILHSARYQLVEGQLRFWAWILAHGFDEPISAIIYDGE